MHATSFHTAVGHDIETAKQYLEQGEVVAVPTETVYGLAGNALDEEAVLKIFTVKNRPHFDPLIVHTHSKEQLMKYVEHLPAVAEKLIDAFMPGPLTLLLKKKDVIPDLVTSGYDTVAIRIPAHPLTLQLLKELSFPLAAPSANPFGYLSPTTAQHVYHQLHTRIPYILEGGATEVGIESTILGIEDGQLIVYRLGGLAVEEIEKLAGKVRIAHFSSLSPRAPGNLVGKHYAPVKEIRFGALDGLNHAAHKEAEEKRIAFVGFDRYLEHVSKENQELLSPSGDLHEAAKHLFSTLRKFDSGDADIIYAVEFPETGLGRAINDRLRRASH